MHGTETRSGRERDSRAASVRFGCGSNDGAQRSLCGAERLRAEAGTRTEVGALVERSLRSETSAAGRSRGGGGCGATVGRSAHVGGDQGKPSLRGAPWSQTKGGGRVRWALRPRLAEPFAGLLDFLEDVVHVSGGGPHIIGLNPLAGMEDQGLLFS